MGQFYYCQAENVLCVLSGKPGQARWVQINPDTNTSIKTHTIDVATTSGVTTVTSNIQEKSNVGGTVTDGTLYSPSFKITGDNGVEVSSALDDNNVPVITVEGEQKELSVAQGTGAQALKTAIVTLESDTYDTTAGDRDSTVTFVAGTDMSMSVNANDNTITFNFAGKNIGNANLIISDGDVDTSGSTEGFTITLDDNSHSTHGYFDPTIQLGTHNQSTDLIHFDNGNAVLPVYTKDEVDEKVKDFDAMTYKGTIGTSGTYTGVDIGGTAASGTLTEVKTGDTFKVSGSITGAGLSQKFKDANGLYYGVAAGNNAYNQIPINNGDLLIAQGTEGADGNITSASLYFDYVPSANDYDSQYAGKTVDNGIKFYEKGAGDTNGLIGGITIAVSSDNDALSVTDNTTAGTTNVMNTVTLKHKENFGANGSMVPAGDTAHVSAGQDGYTMKRATGIANTQLDIQVPQFTYDKAGHLKTVSYVTYTVVDTYGAGGSVIDYKAENITSTTPNTATATFNSVADISIVSEAADGTQSTKTMKLKSSTLKLEQDGTKDLKINLVWGTF